MGFLTWALQTLMILGVGVGVLFLGSLICDLSGRILRKRHEFWLACLILCRYMNTDEERIKALYEEAIDECRTRNGHPECDGCTRMMSDRGSYWYCETCGYRASRPVSNDKGGE